MMKLGSYFAICVDREVVGGMIAFRLGHDCRNLGRIWLDPSVQGRGHGRAAIEWLHDALPTARWSLETPAWAIRNRHLYESLGYRKVGQRPCPDGFVEFLYERESERRPVGGAVLDD